MDMWNLWLNSTIWDFKERSFKKRREGQRRTLMQENKQKRQRRGGGRKLRGGSELDRNMDRRGLSGVKWRDKKRTLPPSLFRSTEKMSGDSPGGGPNPSARFLLPPLSCLRLARLVLVPARLLVLVSLVNYPLQVQLLWWLPFERKQQEQPLHHSAAGWTSRERPSGKIPAEDLCSFWRKHKKCKHAEAGKLWTIIQERKAVMDWVDVNLM